MDRRIPLRAGAALPFEGMPCAIEGELGRGSNALVYRAWYPDAYAGGLRHHVLVKELFPWDPEGGVTRDEAGCECQRKSEPSANQYLSHLC